MSDVKSPEMREELVGHLRELSDIDYQRRVWVNGISEGSIQHDEFDYAVHFLFDDTHLAGDPISTVGWILRSPDEVDLIKALEEAIEAIFKKYGTRLSDAQYISLAEWEMVIDCAKKALLVIAGDCRS